ncbi:olfactory receptor 6B1 [Xenopus laevis]|uniref:Olfactory receptor n=2 Tax=Xenopus laevis TaxID=8355 RepID=A0A974I4N1_XENLA|nr:olfactory receptor 6B1 [Xenopus laevis]OCU01570.1 hypothetical protein XELAEV_18007361mg [Xenopus laevis]
MMMLANKSTERAVPHFILLGFQSSPANRSCLLLFFVVAYIIIILQNVAVIVVVHWDSKLHTPMYFFLTKLACLETLYVSVTVPKILACLATSNNAISVGGCILQLYFFLSLACTECFLLAAMAFDRYLAICVPLRYHCIMTSKMCWSLTWASLFMGFLSCSFSVGLISKLNCCGPNVINHFVCDISPVINLSCEDISAVELVDFIAALIVLLSSSVPIIVSYIYIISTIRKISSEKGWKKTFSTCASHLTVVIIFFGTTIFMYARPKAIQSFDFNKFLSVLYSVIIPVINPMIYTLRNNDMKRSMKNMFGASLPLRK